WLWLPVRHFPNIEFFDVLLAVVTSHIQAGQVIVIEHELHGKPTRILPAKLPHAHLGRVGANPRHERQMIYHGVGIPENVSPAYQGKRQRLSRYALADFHNPT